jgi:alanine dehydrogenase
LKEAVRRNDSLAKGINVIEGRVSSRPVAEAHGLEYEPLEHILPIDLDSGQIFGS